jgi:hypothetical protein
MNLGVGFPMSCSSAPPAAWEILLSASNKFLFLVLCLQNWSDFLSRDKPSEVGRGSSTAPTYELFWEEEFGRSLVAQGPYSMF